MADVIVTFKVMPTGVEVDLDTMEKNVRSSVDAQRVDREPVAFGLVALIVVVVVEDAGGQVDAVENKLRAIPDVSDVEVTHVTRAL